MGQKKSLAELLRDFGEEVTKDRTSPFELQFPVLRPYRPLLPHRYPGELKEIRLSFEAASIKPSKFEAQEYEVYHGTSTDALDKILEQGQMLPGAYLLKTGELIHGELKRDVEESPKLRGPKAIPVEALIDMGIELTEEDKRIFGHAYAVFFAAHPTRSLSYTPKEPENRAIIGLNRNALASGGYQLVDCGTEGIKIDGHVSIGLSPKTLLVPNSRVEEYRKKMEAKFGSVYPLSDLEI